MEVDGPAAPTDSEPSQPGLQNAEADGSGDSVAAQLLGRRLTRNTSGSSAAASAPAQPPGHAGEACQQNGGRAAWPGLVLAGGKGSGISGQQAGKPAAEPAAAAEAAMAAEGSSGQQPAGGGNSKSKSSWVQDEQGWWRRTLPASACRGSSSSLALPRDLFKELVGRSAEGKDQLEVVGAGGQSFCFQYTIRADGACMLIGTQLGRWGADAGAQAGDLIALRRSGSHVEVRLIPASGAAAGKAAAGSPSPASAPAAAQAGGAAARRTRRSSTEEQEQGQGRAPAAPAAVAAAGGKGSKRRSSERQEQQDGAAAAAAAAAAPAAAGSGGKGGGKRLGRPRQREQGGPAVSAPAAAGSTEHFPSGGASPHKGWQKDGDGWWRRPLTASACGTSQSARTAVKLGFPAGLFRELTGKMPNNAEDLLVVDARTGRQLTFPYRKDLSGGGSNITGAALSRLVVDSGAQEGDFIALRRSGSKIEVRCIPASTAAGGPGRAAAAAAAVGTAPGWGGKGAKRRRASSEEEGEAAEAAAAGTGGGGRKPGRAAKSKQPGATAGQAAQRATRGAGAGAAAPQGVESQLSGEALLNRRIEVLFDDGEWYAGLVMHVHRGRWDCKYEVYYDDDEYRQESLRPGEWRLLEDDEPPAAAERQARQARQAEKVQQAADGRRRVAAGGGKAHAKRQQLPAAEVEQQLPAEEAGEALPPKKRQRKSRTATPAADEGPAQQAEQPEEAGGERVPPRVPPLQHAEQEQQVRQQPAKQARQRGKPAAKEAALLLQPGQDAAALVQSGRGKRKAAEAAKAGVQAALRAEQGGEVAPVTDAPLPPEVPLEQGPFATVAAAPAAAAEAADAAAAGAAAPAAAPARQASAQRRRASGAAKSRAAAAPPVQPPAGSAAQQAAGALPPAAAAGPAAAAAAVAAAGPAAGEALPPCYWYEQRQAPFNQNLPREARKAELRSQYERDGLSLTSCHDCQEPCYRYPCQSGLGTPPCNKTFCHKCTELYRYLLAFGPEQPEQYELRRRFVAGHCPCCLRICLRSKCRQKSLEQLGGEAPVPHDTVSRQIVMSYHLARRLLPAVEQIMALHQEEARAARTTLDAAEVAEIGYVGSQRAPHSERALCNRCATCLENLHFHCAGCDQDICPICAREARQGKATATVKCTACRTAMQPMRFLDNGQLAMLQHARQRLDAALGGGPSGSSGTCGSARIDAAASPLPRLLWNLCKGSCGCEHERAEWIEPHTDWVQELRQAAAFAARHAPPALAPQQVRQQGQQAPGSRGPRLPPRRVQQQQQQQQQQQPAQQPLQQQAQPLQQNQQQPLPPVPPPQRALQQPLQLHAPATAAVQAPAAASGPVGVSLWPMQQMKQLLAAVQGKAAAVSLPQAQHMLQHTLRLLFRGEEGKMPGWAATRAPWTPAELQLAQDYIQRLVDAQLPAPVQPPQPSVLLAQLQQPQLAQPQQLQQQLPQQPQPLLLQQQQPALPNGTAGGTVSGAASGAASGSASQEGWPKMVARPASQQSGGMQSSGWNASSWVQPTLPGEQQQQQQPDATLAARLTQAAFAAVLAGQEQQQKQPQASGAAQQQQQQQQEQQAHPSSAAQQEQQALANGVRPAGIAEEGAEPRPKRQRKFSQKALDAAGDEEGARVAGQQRQQAARRAPAPAPMPGAPAEAPAAALAGQQQQQQAAQLPKELSPLERDERQWWWLAEQLPPTDVRLASHRGTQDFIWTPHADQFAADHPHFDRTIRIFQMLWERGEPIIVRGLRGSMGWTPEAMGRVCKESNSTKLQVIACSDSWSLRELTPRDFFERYKRCSGDTLSSDSNEPLPMLKLKDFPPTSDFKQVMARHHDDFLQLLNRCLPAYTHPTGGALNLACHLPWYTRLPDLGPKGYIAFGREEENEGEGDSVTKMHEDLSDAINIMLHVQHRAGAPPGPPRHGYAEAQVPGYGGAGAVWDLVRREDRPALRRFLADALAGKIEGCPPFVHKGRELTPADVHDVMHDQCFMLTAKHRALLAREPYGVHVWHVEQYEHEAVWIPGGCAHQVRNLRSSIKVALDFVSPDAVHECLELRGEFRQGAKKELELWQAEHPGQLEEDVGSRHYADKLQIGNMVLFGFLNSLTVLETVAEGSFHAIPRFPPLLQQPWKDPEEEAAAGLAAGGKPRRARLRQGSEEDEVEGEEGWEAEEEEGGGPSRGGGKRRR